MKPSWVKALASKNRTRMSPVDIEMSCSDDAFLADVKTSPAKQRELISLFIADTFPTFYLSAWKNIGDLSGTAHI